MTVVLAATLAAACDVVGCDLAAGRIRRTYPPPPEGSYAVSTQQLGIGDAAPIPIETAAVTGEFFKAVEVQAALGRLFAPFEYTAAATGVAVLSHDLWKEKFAGSPEIVGQGVTLDGRRVVIVGVAQPGFSGPAGARLWVPSMKR